MSMICQFCESTDFTRMSPQQICRHTAVCSKTYIDAQLAGCKVLNKIYAMVSPPLRTPEKINFSGNLDRRANDRRKTKGWWKP